jgi:hypothetical protein
VIIFYCELYDQKELIKNLAGPSYAAQLLYNTQKIFSNFFTAKQMNLTIIKMES